MFIFTVKEQLRAQRNVDVAFSEANNVEKVLISVMLEYIEPMCIEVHV